MAQQMIHAKVTGGHESGPETVDVYLVAEIEFAKHYARKVAEEQGFVPQYGTVQVYILEVMSLSSPAE